jgi:DNA-binding transcriptional ArsR family regulator
MTTVKAAQAVDKLASLAQESRLRIFRLLVQAGPAGMNAGAIAEAIGIPANTLSFHIAHLARAGMVAPRQEGRYIYYAANYLAMDDLLAYLTDNCCQGGGQCLPKTVAAASTAKRRRQAA